MAKQIYVGAGGLARKGKKAYLGIDGVARKVNRMYIGDASGLARLCFSGGVDVAALGITYTGNMTDAGVVTLSDGEYRLLTLTSSGTLTVDEEVNAEVWMCGGGTSGQAGSGATSSGGGGAGAFTETGSVTLSGDMVATIGSGGAAKSNQNSASTGWFNSGGATAFAGLTTSTAFTAASNLVGGGVNGGTGGGARGGQTLSAAAGQGDGVSKYPFGDTSYFAGKPHCAGGGGASYSRYNAAGSLLAKGGAGGTNGGNGSTGAAISDGGSNVGGAGGTYGGGAGSNATSSGSAATFYGSGGGGSGQMSGAGYQGVIYIRIPVEQGGSVTPTMISFGIDGTTYYAEDGMTWNNWVDSDYNTANMRVNDSNTEVIDSSGNALWYSNYETANTTKVAPSDLIIAGVHEQGYGGYFIDA